MLLQNFLIKCSILVDLDYLILEHHRCFFQSARLCQKLTGQSAALEDKMCASHSNAFFTFYARAGALFGQIGVTGIVGDCWNGHVAAGASSADPFIWISALPLLFLPQF